MSLRSQFFQNLRYFSSQAKERSKPQCWGDDGKSVQFAALGDFDGRAKCFLNGRGKSSPPIPAINQHVFNLYQAVFVKAKTPGEMIHIDTKKLGRVDGVGHRIAGDRVGQSNKRFLKTGDPAGNTFALLWTITRGWPTPRSCRMRRVALVYDPSSTLCASSGDMGSGSTAS